MKINISGRNNLNNDLLKEAFEVTDNPDEADFIISQSTCLYPQYISKTIYIAIEPPRTEHRIWCYNNFNNFHTVYCHNPEPYGPNVFPINSEDKCQYFPTKPDPFTFHTRTDTTITNRGVFYAGMINVYDNGPDACGGWNITGLRSLLGNYFMKEFPDSQIIGIGWKGQNSKVDNWREDKYNQIIDSNCDFVLAMENTILPNYLYEKIWDGFATDRVTMYLGDPNIEKHIPTNCFIDLRPYYNVVTREFKIDELCDYLRNMTQEEYDTILNNARKFRETAKGQHKYHMNKFTNEVIERIKNG